MKIKKKICTLFTHLFVMITVFALTTMPTYAGIWDEFSKYHSSETEAQAAQALSPFLKFAFFLLAIIGTIVTVITILMIGVKAGKVKAGKDSFTKKWVLETAAVIIICILVSGGSWIKIFKAGQTIIVDPATNILTNQPVVGGQGTPQPAGGGQGTPAPKP